MKNKKKVLLIGASGGIGHETAKVLLESDYKVIGTYNTDQKK